jgi:cysteinyl-tRNA synthetase
MLSVLLINVGGPTVYDFSHLGHARNYVSLDVLRRIMTHLGYDVNMVMNGTETPDTALLLHV